MKILFLDFDGVLNDVGQVHKRSELDFDAEFQFLDEFATAEFLDTDKIKNLNYIVDQTKCFIVLSTAWRMYGLDFCKKVLMMRGFRYPHRIIDMTPTQSFSGKDYRVHEVNLWLLLNDPDRDLKNYVMVDDDIDDEGAEIIGRNHCVITTYAENVDDDYGLTDEKVFEVIDKLTGRGYVYN